MHEQIRAKVVVVHIGPHKTGSTAIQQCLSENTSSLLQRNVYFLHNKATHDAAMLLVHESFEAAEVALQSISTAISALDQSTVILSQEDFCGDIPGRSRQRSIYPKLTRNLRVIARCLAPHHVRFVFFERDVTDWIRSCYHQHLKYRTQFSSFDEFQAHYSLDSTWSNKLAKPRETFGADFLVVPYSKSVQAGVSALLELAGLSNHDLVVQPTLRNASPTPDQISALERINLLSAFKETAWFSKTLLLRGWRPSQVSSPKYSQSCRASPIYEVSLPDLAHRVRARIQKQDVEDILPPADMDLKSLLEERLPLEAQLPTQSRSNIRDQSRILDYHFRGKSLLAKQNALVISYLRRDTTHTVKARTLFHRIWDELGVELVNELSTRWLISTLQTFLDHGKNEEQRLIGAGGYFYGNMLKIYEGERAIEGREQDATYGSLSAQTPNRFPGLDRYSVGGTDLLLNTNAMLLELATRDDVAGLVLNEFLLRVKHSANVFTRMDRTRRDNDINVPGFEDTWSFFAAPK